MTPCVLWDGALDRNGYGRVYVDGKIHYAHRAVYVHAVGPIPDGWEVDHLCRVRGCVNPEHLEAVSRTINVRRQYGITPDDRCRNGHRNWRSQVSGRYCRTCKTDVARERRHAV